MEVFSIIRGEWVTATPDVDTKTNRIIGFTVEGQKEIEPPQLFFSPPPIDWERVRIQAAINAVGGLSSLKTAYEKRLQAATIVHDAVLIADKLIAELQNKNKQ